MNAIRSHHISRRIAMLLALVMLTSISPLGLLAATAQQARKTVIVFPLQNAAEGAPGDIAQRATGAMSMAISDVPGFDAIQFSATSPSVRRAVSEGRVRQVDVEEGSGDLATALVIGAALQVDYVVVGAVQSFTRKDTPVGVEVILAGQMYEVAPNINPATGEPIAEPKAAKAFGVSGASKGRLGQTAAEASMVQEAVRAAASKAAAALSGTADVSDISSARKKSSGGYKWVIFALLLGGLALAVNNGGGSNNTGTSADAFPPRNVSLEENQGAIAVTWYEPTGTTLSVLRYQIERSADSGPFQRVDPGNISPGYGGAPAGGPLTYNDYTLQTGRHTYQYRLRTTYTSGAVSAYAYSGALTVTR